MIGLVNTKMSDHLFEEIKLHEKWKKDPKSYQKPPRPDPLAPRVARLINVPNSEHSLSYVLFVDGKNVAAHASGAFEFLYDDPEPLRKAILHMKTKPGFHVYYKHGPYWYGVPQNFESLSAALPYLQNGNRVIVEYRFTKK